MFILFVLVSNDQQRKTLQRGKRVGLIGWLSARQMLITDVLLTSTTQ
jgi:hypothetical protein